MAGKLHGLIRAAIRVMILHFSAIPSIWVVLNPLLYIMFLPLGLHYVMTMPWPFLKDLPDPFGRGTSLYFLTYLYSALLNGWPSSFWRAIGYVLILSGGSLFLWSFSLWLKSRGKLMTNGPYRLIRHPQYFGIIMAILGLSVHAARPIAFISWGTMTYAYVLMAYFEEQSLMKRLEKEYTNYRAGTWFMVPAPKILTKRIARAQASIVTLAGTIVLLVYILTVVYVSYGRVLSLRGVTF